MAAAVGKALRAKLGGGFSATDCDLLGGYVGSVDVTYLWDEPDEAVRRRVRGGRAGLDERLRVSMADQWVLEGKGEEGGGDG